MYSDDEESSRASSSGSYSSEEEDEDLPEATATYTVNRGGQGVSHRPQQHQQRRYSSSSSGSDESSDDDRSHHPSPGINREPYAPAMQRGSRRSDSDSQSLDESEESDEELTPQRTPPFAPPSRAPPPPRQGQGHASRGARSSDGEDSEVSSSEDEGQTPVAQAGQPVAKKELRKKRTSPYKESSSSSSGSDSESNHHSNVPMGNGGGGSASSSGSDSESDMEAYREKVRRKAEAEATKRRIEAEEKKKKSAEAAKKKKKMGKKAVAHAGGCKKKSTKKKHTKKKSPSLSGSDSENSEEENVMAAVVLAESTDDDSTSEDEIVAVAVATPVKKKGGSKKKKAQGKKTTPSSKKGTGGKRKTSKRKTKGKNRKYQSSSDESSSSDEDAATALELVSSVPPEKLDAAAEARSVLLHAVPRLPVELSETHTVRSFGRIKIEGAADDDMAFDPLDALYSSASAIHPVGFSCDRYEFSPVHGRVIKMRCDILDGGAVRRTKEEEARRKKKADQEEEEAVAVVSEDEKKDDAPPATPTPVVVVSKDRESSNGCKSKDDGPIFRIMWGKGIDESVDAQSDIPFDPYSSSAPLGTNGPESNGVDAVALPLHADGSDAAATSTTTMPEVGMRVSVRFDRDQWYGGSVTKVSESSFSAAEGDGKKKKLTKKFSIRIQYDDGAKEDAIYPDPDIILRPGLDANDIDGGTVDLTELNGKPVTTVTGRTALEAWGKTLVAMGLIDEIMHESAFKALEASRLEGKAEAMGKLEAQKIQRQQQRARQQQRQQAAQAAAAKEEEQKSVKEDERTDAIAEKDTPPIVVKIVDGEVVGSTAPFDSADEDDDGSFKNEEEEEVEREQPTETEQDLLAKIELLRSRHRQALAESQRAAVDLADARIASFGPFLCNPFHEKDVTQQSSWLATVVRKEKAKMGSTGNKRKVVTPTDLLERNDTFFSPDIEQLVEGLPGSEYCPAYVFASCRASGAAAATQAWVHEVQIRHEKERDKRLKSAKEAKAKASQLREKELKRKERDEERESRKRQRVEEAELKKKAREEERLSRLSVQVDERLRKEACFQREKVVLLMAKATGREFARRRKVAELVSFHAVAELESSKKKNESRNGGGLLELATLEKLPLPLAKQYDGEILRVWDFICSFRDAFDNVGSLPSLDSLQDAINLLRRGDGDNDDDRDAAVDLLTNLAIVLCKPLAAGLLKTLSSVVLSTSQASALQKENNAGSSLVDASISTLLPKQDANASNITFPVTKLTWREVARMFLIGDGLFELGYTRQEVGYFLRGFRSGGHPNSKEAKRLRKGEDFAVILLRGSRAAQAARKAALVAASGGSTGGVKVRVHVPCAPSASPLDWTFYLHNVKCLPATAIADVLKNVRKALALVKTKRNDLGKGVDAESVTADLQRGLAMLERLNPNPTGGELSIADMGTCNKAKQAVLKVLERSTGEVYSANCAPQKVYRADIVQKEGSMAEKGVFEPHHTRKKLMRQRMGLISSIFTTRETYKKAINAREDYMTAALRYKEEMDRRERAERKRAEGRKAEEEEEEEDDDDDDDDDEDDNEDAEDSSKALDGTNDASKDTGNGADDAEKPSATEPDPPEPTNPSLYSEQSIKLKPEPTNASEEAIETAKSEDATVEVIATVVETNDVAVDATAVAKVGKKTQYDDFCSDEPLAHELIRRCLAVLRTVCLSVPAEPFVYPVDPQMNARYYEAVLKPVCFQDIGKGLKEAGKRLLAVGKVQSIGEETSVPAAHVPKDTEADKEAEAIVAQFARDIRLIAQNCMCYSNVGAALISSAEEMLRIFERLLLDWVLAPPDVLPSLENLDDDKCIDHHPSDAEEGSVVLLCDGCEGKFNMARLDPPLDEIPTGDWYCPRCVSGRCWATLDPRIGRKVQKLLPTKDGSTKKLEGTNVSGTVKTCLCRYVENSTTPNLLYVIQYDTDEETWPLKEVDRALKEGGNPVPPIRCLEAIAESRGYGITTDSSLLQDVVPVPLNPTVSDYAAQVFTSSSVFNDTVVACATLALKSPDEISASEWVRLLTLLAIKCSSSDVLQNLSSVKESEAADKMSKDITALSKLKDVCEILPNLMDEEDGPEIDDDDSNKKPNIAENNTEIKEKMANPEKKPSVPKKKKSGKRKEVLFGDEESSEEENESEDNSEEEAEWEDDAQQLPTTIKAIKTEGDVYSKEGRGKKRRASEIDVAMPMANEASTGAVKEGNSDPNMCKNNTKDTGDNLAPVPDTTPSEGEIRSKMRAAAFSAKASRQKAREDSFASYCIKSKMRPTVASFEEDLLSQVIESSLASKEPGLCLAAVRCRNKACHFCGLPDHVLGTPLVRVPNQTEWVETIIHASRRHVTCVVAEVAKDPSKRVGINHGKEGSATTSLSDPSDANNMPKDAAESKDGSQTSQHGNAIDTAKPTGFTNSKDAVDSNDFEGDSKRSHEGSLKICDKVPDVPVSSEAVKVKNDSPAEDVKTLCVKIRVEGEIISECEGPTQVFDGVSDGGMLEFLPRNSDGFQSELAFRQANELPFVTGSLSAHECCAVAAHKVRTEKMVQEYKDRQMQVVERDAARLCGRTLPLGTDKLGRPYWKFSSDPSSLFVRCNGAQQNRWHRFHKAETIASVVVWLNKQSPAEEIMRVFPKAAKMLRNGKWAEMLQKRVFPLDPSKQVNKESDSEEMAVDDGKSLTSALTANSEKPQDVVCTKTTPVEEAKPSATDGDDIQEDLPYDEGEDVLVESASGKLLWAASVVAVSKNRTTEKVNGYRVHYKEWSSRFDEWVEPFRVVEPSENNLLVQGDMLREFLASRDAVPAVLEHMSATSYLHARNRARGFVSLPNFEQLASVGPSASLEDKQVGILKAALLLIEAALPVGAVDVSESGFWKPEFAATWRSMVTEAQGPVSLAGCVILLEDALSADWLFPQAEQMLSCMPRHWKAASDSSVPSVAVRIWLLDLGLKYTKIDKGRKALSSGNTRGRRAR